ncbi:MAG TPA: NAD(+)/NADH kinase [Gaiellaceae bacterium]|nr:NAD(+)/NADH kinase [Gaiellaceae bacterium]
MPPVERVAVVVHGSRDLGDAVERLRAVARRAGAELFFDGERDDPDVALVLGGDGTMLRALARFLGSGVPVLGVNFGRVGFLTAIDGPELEAGVARVLAGEYRTIELPTLELEHEGRRYVAVNDTVVASATMGRMVELDYEIGGENLGVQPCDGLICATPPGSTAYNLSNGGPVLVWGLDAMVVTFVAPHTLHARPLVVGRGVDVVVENRSAGVPAGVLVDGHRHADLPPGGRVAVRLGPERSRLAVLPEQTFFTRYGQVFAPG